jgi:hypothetical protein
MGVGAVAAVAVIVLLVGSASAAPTTLPRATTTYKAPYSGTGDGGLGIIHSGCGNTASSSVLPGFNLTTGIATFAGKAGDSSCGSVNSTVGFFLEAGFLSDSFTTTAGTHNLSAKWSLTFSESLAATPGGAHPGALASVYVLLALVVDDLTNGTSTVSSSFLTSHEVVTGTYSHNYSKLAGTPYYDRAYVKGHTYDFQVEIEIEIAVEVGVGSNKASASVSMGTGSQGATLSSVTFK